jgi:2-hydroxy-6-oxonona-2,4-dienedioate hydrolase
VILLGRKQLREHWDVVNQLRIFSRVSRREFQGSELPLVLVHGLGVSSRYMTPLACQWAAEHPVYVPDLPGYGRSQRPKCVLDVNELAHWLRDWLRIAGIERAAFVGNSMGCQILVELAHVDASCILAAAFLGPTMDQTAKSRFSHVVRLFKDQFHEPLTLIPLQAFDYVTNGPIRTVKTFLNAVKHDMRGRVARLEAPCLVLRGERDDIVSPEWAAELAGRLRCASFHTIPGAGHALNYNSAPVIAPLILEFWNRWGISV